MRTLLVQMSSHSVRVDAYRPSMPAHGDTNPPSVSCSGDDFGSLPRALGSRLADIVSQFDALSRQLEDPDVLGDHRRVRELSIKRAALAPVAEAALGYRSVMRQAAALERELSQGLDEDLAEIAHAERTDLNKRAGTLVDRLKSTLVTTDDRAVASVILEIRAGTGGDEAGLWAADLLSMYERYAGTRGWSFEELDLVADPSVGGIRHATVGVSGEGVWSELLFESGVHAVKRVPKTETQGRIHTSTATVAVLPEPEELAVNINWAKDVDEHITTAQGPGGQNVNKVATAVLLRHKPTGVEVRMQETKSQQQNREKARRLLLARVYDIERAKAEAERSAERRGQIGTGQRSERIRVYRYQDGIVADQRLDEKLQLKAVLEDADLAPMFAALIEQETARRLAAL